MAKEYCSNGGENRNPETIIVYNSCYSGEIWFEDSLSYKAVHRNRPEPKDFPLLRTGERVSLRSDGKMKALIQSISGKMASEISVNYYKNVYEALEGEETLLSKLKTMEKEYVKDLTKEGIEWEKLFLYYDSEKDEAWFANIFDWSLMEETWHDRFSK